MDNFIINFYRTPTNTCPVEEFLDSLDKKMKAKMLRMIVLLENHGLDLREPYSKHLDDNIFELRAQQGNNISRILYFFTNNRQIILTNGFIKKTNKTPQGVISKAKRYREDYLKRKEFQP